MGKSIDIGLLFCQHCKSKLEMNHAQEITCINCGAVFTYHRGALVFKQYDADHLTDGLDQIKSLFKKWGKFYHFLIEVFSPVFAQLKLKSFLQENLHDNMIIINLGSGNSDLSEKITNVDIFPYKNVNLCCDIENIPVISDAVDVIINIAVLEHVSNPENVVNEIHRILKPGGILYTYFPFMQPYHASPYDYSRRTVEGLKKLHQMFDIKEIRIGAGPTSGFLWVFQEWLAILLSFGIKRLHRFFYLFIMILTFPLKYLDLLLSGFSTSENIASAFIIIAQKK